MLILKQNTAASVPTPAAGKGTIFLSDSDVLSVKNSSGAVESFPTVGGSNTQVIFNDDAALSGSANYTFDKTTNVLTVTGNVAATRVLTDNLLYANGSPWDLQQPAGANTQVIFNDDGDFGADSTFTFDKDTDTLTASNISGSLTTAAQTNITSLGTLTALSVNGNIGTGNISATGELSGATLSTTGNAVVGGNLTVNGNLTYVNVDSFAVEDPIISLGGGPNGNALVSNDGKDRGTELQYFSGTAKTAFMGYDNGGAEFIFGKEVSITDEVVTVSTYGNVHGNVFIGSGSDLSDIVGANVTGTVGNATYATSAGTVDVAAQPNITSVGTLTGLVAGSGSTGDFGNTILIASHDNTGVTGDDYIGIVGESTGDASNTSFTGIGVAGFGRTNVGTRGSGIYGEALVTNSTDTGAAVGVRGIAESTHSGGYNIGLYGTASGSSVDNAALYLQTGNIITEDFAIWNLLDNDANALAFNSTGKANIFAIETTDGQEGVFASGYMNVTGNITATAGVITDNLYYANGNPWDLQQPAGSNTQVIFNNAGDFGASSNFTFDTATNILAVTGAVNGTTLGGSLTTAAQPNITSVGTLSGLSVTAPITGSITGSAGSATGSAATVTGAAQANITSVGTLTSLAVTGNITSGNVAGTGGVFTYVSGDGANLTSVPGAQITGEVTFAATANAVAGANVSGEVGFADVANSVAGGNVSGTVALASVAGTVSGAAQANITSVGTLTGLGVNGTITASAITANTGLFTGDGGGLSNVAGGNVTGQVANALVSGTVYTAAQPNITSVGTLSSVTTSGNVDVSGNVVTDLIIGKTSGITITAIGVDQPITLVPTGTGTVAVSSKRITGLGTPTASTDATTKAYVDSVAQGLAIQAPCIVASTATFASMSGGTITYDNGTAGVGATLTTTSAITVIDGITLSASDRILIKDEITEANNGIYVYTSSTVLTRATDFDTPTEMSGGDFVFVTSGTVNNDSGYVMTDPVTTVGTSPVLFSQFSGAGTYTAGTGLTLTGTEFLITNTAVTAQAYGNGTHNATFTVNEQGQLTNASNVAITANAEVLTGTSLNSSVVDSSLTSVGTIDTGVWQGTAIGAAYVSTLNQNTTGYAATVSGAAQANITSVGTLSALSVTATITGSVSGSAGSANSVAGANVSGTVANATYATTSGSTTQAVTFNNAGSGAASGTTFNGGTARTISYNSVGAPSTTGGGASGTWGINVSGSAASATTAGTVTTAAQPNITSVGTLTSLGVTGTTTTGTLQSTIITTGSNSTAGTITGDFTLTAGSTLNATYADLAEKYLANEDLEPGTVVLLGGDAEVQALGVANSTKVAGIVTTNPAQVYNAGLVAGEGQFVVELALIGRVPCKVMGPIMPGDLIVSSEMPGYGCAADEDNVKPGTIIGKAITGYNGAEDVGPPDGVCEVLVGRC